MAQPVEMTAEELREGIVSGTVGPRSLVSRDGSAPIEWSRHPDFAELSASMGLRVSGDHRAVSDNRRVETLRRIRDKHRTLTGSHPVISADQLTVSGSTLKPRSYTPSQAMREGTSSFRAHGWQEPEDIPVNEQWRGLALTKTYEALLDVPVLEVFGLPWSAPRNAVNMALLNLTTEMEKEAPKDETVLDAGVREKVIEVLAACHSAYTLPAHNLVAMRIQHRFERIPFVSEILPYYLENVVGARRRQTKTSSSSDSSSKTRSTTTRTSTGADSQSKSKGKGKDDAKPAAASGNTRTFAIVGAVLIALAAGYNVMDCGGGDSGGSSGGIGPDGRPLP